MMQKLGLSEGHFPEDEAERKRLIEDMKKLVEDRHDNHQAVHDAIMESRPAMVSNSVLEDKIETFADHFAAAMLLNPV